MSGNPRDATRRSVTSIDHSCMNGLPGGHAYTESLFLGVHTSKIEHRSLCMPVCGCAAAGLVRCRCGGLSAVRSAALYIFARRSRARVRDD